MQKDAVSPIPQMWKQNQKKRLNIDKIGYNITKWEQSLTCSFINEL